MARSCALIMCALLLSSWTGLSQHPAEGHWEGAITIQGIPLNIRVDIRWAADSLRATIDIPQQSAVGLPLVAVRYAAPKLHFELPAGPGLAVFDGTLSGEGVRGDFRQAGFAGTFQMHRTTMTLRHEVRAEEPVPYRQEEVRFSNAGITLVGTLTLPVGEGRHPAIVLLTGSGPENRDEEIFGFKIFRIIADTLTRNGVAVLRFDDRGVGGSGGVYAQTTTDDYAGDALAAVEFLGQRSDIDRKRVGLFGHSEGALAAAIACASSPTIAFAVFMAGPGVRGDSLILSQVEILGKAAGLDDSELQRQLQLQQRVFDVVRANDGWDSLRRDLSNEILRGYHKAGVREQGGVSVDSLAQMQSRAQIQGLSTPWFRRFITIEPGAFIRRMHCPLLAMFAEKDMQVAPEINRNRIEEYARAGGVRELTVKVIPGANHLFQKAETGHPSEYGGLKKEFAPGVLGEIVAWVARQTLSGR